VRRPSFPTPTLSTTRIDATRRRHIVNLLAPPLSAHVRPKRTVLWWREHSLLCRGQKSLSARCPVAAAAAVDPVHRWHTLAPRVRCRVCHSSSPTQPNSPTRGLALHHHQGHNCSSDRTTLRHARHVTDAASLCGHPHSSTYTHTYLYIYIYVSLLLEGSDVAHLHSLAPVRATAATTTPGPPMTAFLFSCLPLRSPLLR
jgi:hypothetical protein